jgi:hypothetical protein
VGRREHRSLEATARCLEDDLVLVGRVLVGGVCSGLLRVEGLPRWGEHRPLVVRKLVRAISVILA